MPEETIADKINAAREEFVSSIATKLSKTEDEKFRKALHSKISEDLDPRFFLLDDSKIRDDFASFIAEKLEPSYFDRFISIFTGKDINLTKKSSEINLVSYANEFKKQNNITGRITNSNQEEQESASPLGFFDIALKFIGLTKGPTKIDYTAADKLVKEQAKAEEERRRSEVAAKAEKERRRAERKKVKEATEKVQLSKLPSEEGLINKLYDGLKSQTADAIIDNLPGPRRISRQPEKASSLNQINPQITTSKDTTPPTKSKGELYYEKTRETFLEIARLNGYEKLSEDSENFVKGISELALNSKESYDVIDGILTTFGKALVNNLKNKSDEMKNERGEYQINQSVAELIYNSITLLPQREEKSRDQSQTQGISHERELSPPTDLAPPPPLPPEGWMPKTARKSQESKQPTSVETTDPKIEAPTHRPNLNHADLEAAKDKLKNSGPVAAKPQELTRVQRLQGNRRAAIEGRDDTDSDLSGSKSESEYEVTSESESEISKGIDTRIQRNPVQRSDPEPTRETSLRPSQHQVQRRGMGNMMSDAIDKVMRNRSNDTGHSSSESELEWSNTSDSDSDSKSQTKLKTAQAQSISSSDSEKSDASTQSRSTTSSRGTPRRKRARPEAKAAVAAIAKAKEEAAAIAEAREDTKISPEAKAQAKATLQGFLLERHQEGSNQGRVQMRKSQRKSGHGHSV